MVNALDGAKSGSRSSQAAVQPDFKKLVDVLRNPGGFRLSSAQMKAAMLGELDKARGRDTEFRRAIGEYVDHLLSKDNLDKALQVAKAFNSIAQARNWDPIAIPMQATRLIGGGIVEAEDGPMVNGQLHGEGMTVMGFPSGLAVQTNANFVHGVPEGKATVTIWRPGKSDEIRVGTFTNGEFVETK